MTLFRPLSDIVEEQRQYSSSAHPRLPSGFSVMDGRTGGGAAQGEMILLTARSSVGKTWMALHTVRCNVGVPTVFFSLEMQARYIAHRLAAVHTNTPTRELEAALRTTGNHPAFDKIVEDFPKLLIVDKPALSFKEMTEALKQAEDEWQEKPRLVVVDFLELVGGVMGLEAAQQVDKAARKAKDFARGNDVVLEVLHQVGRGSGQDGHMPLGLTSGRFGGETMADYLLGAYSPSLEPGIPHEQYLRTRNQLYVQLLKTRSGGEVHPTGVRYRIDPDSRRISEWDGSPPPSIAGRGRSWSEQELQMAGVTAA